LTPLLRRTLPLSCGTAAMRTGVETRHVMPRNGKPPAGKYVVLLRFRRNRTAVPIPASFML
jgi:hypothetical protein